MKITFAGAVKAGIVKGFVFRGVASRREFWFFLLFRVLIGIVTIQLDQLFFTSQGAAAVDATPEAGPLTTISALLLLVPSISVSVRRMRDAGWSAKWMALWLIPIATVFASAWGLAQYLNTANVVEEEALNEAFLQFTAPFVLVTAAVQVFLLILCLLPSKSREQGNKYAPEA